MGPVPTPCCLGVCLPVCGVVIQGVWCGHTRRVVWPYEACGVVIRGVVHDSMHGAYHTSITQWCADAGGVVYTHALNTLPHTQPTPPPHTHINTTHRCTLAAHPLRAKSSCAPGASPGAGLQLGGGVSSCTCVAASGALLAPAAYAATSPRSIDPSCRACVRAVGKAGVGAGGDWGLLAPACSFGPRLDAMCASSSRCATVHGAVGVLVMSSSSIAAMAALARCVCTDSLACGRR